MKTRRGEKIGNAMESHIFSGEFWIGGNAVELGLADGIDSVYSFARREYGDSVRLIEVKKKSNPFEHLVGALTPVTGLHKFNCVISDGIPIVVTT